MTLSAERTDRQAVRPLPRVRSVRIKHLSIYRNRRIIDVAVGAGVFCLAGANGLGKSTFLATVNYALTGVVADPERGFQSVSEYYKDSLDYARTFFDGRVSKLDRDSAEVEVEFVVGAATYRVSRGLFSSRSLRHLEIFDERGVRISRSTRFETDEARNDAYEQQIVADMKLEGFDQLAFLQHFVLTFDERRHLIFWHNEVAEQALYLAFGVDGSLAARADELRRKAERSESQARNLQYQSTVARNRLRDLREAIQVNPDAQVDADLLVRHENLVADRSREASAARYARDQLVDSKLTVAQAAASYQAVQKSYDDAFQSRLNRQRDPSNHPMIRSLMVDHKCHICGTEDEHVAVRAAAAAAANRCPLCETPLQTRAATPASGREELARLDQELSAARGALKNAQDEQRRLEAESSSALARADAAEDALNTFEAENENILSSAAESSEAASVSDLVRTLESEQLDAARRRDEFREVRDAARDELRPVQASLARAYEDAELEFVPIFRGLARRFLGLDLDITLDRKPNSGFQLVLDVESQRRRRTTQLSESQRFFVDIALRMALSQFMAGNEPASLYIDTPEGSLDIAYEARAGDMFAEFVNSGNQLLMTANINTSQLLLELAGKTNADRMTLVRMTDWTPLSEVQAGAEDLFDSAFSQIESRRAQRSGVSGS